MNNMLEKKKYFRGVASLQNKLVRIHLQCFSVNTTLYVQQAPKTFDTPKM
uniref:Uncharacterized protein n=1 Tax=Anguilla anguilla TaxID=7936 RepID=A0A0E9PRY7_ANGAN